MKRIKDILKIYLLVSCLGLSPLFTYAEVIKEIGITTAFTDNLVSSIEAPRKMPLVEQFTGIVNLGIGIRQEYGERNLFYALYRPSLTYHQNADYLRMVKHALFIQANNNISKITTFNVNGDLRYSDFFNHSLLSYASVQLGAFLKQYLKRNFIFESAYDFSTTDYRGIEPFDHNDSLNVSYTLVDNFANTFRIKVKYWPAGILRLSLQDMISFVNYKQTASGRLMSLSGIAFDDTRSDIFNALKLDFAYLPSISLLFDIGYVFEYNGSNSEYFRYNSNNLVFDIMWQPGNKHQILIQSRYGYYHYFDRQFDVRYSNTRKDTRLYFTAIYDYRITDYLKMSARYGFIENGSNDSMDFDASYSTTYSSFGKNDASISLGLTF